MDPILGQIIMVAFGFTPMGWLPCDGRLLPIRQFTALYSLLGTAYGGDGINTFGLPNLNGRFPMGMGKGGDEVVHYNGEIGGQAAATLTALNLPFTLEPTTVAAPAANAPAGSTKQSIALAAAPAKVEPVRTLPPYQALNFIIAYEGIYPSRS